MSDLALTPVSFQTTSQVQQTQPPAPPRPPKSQSDHKPANTSTSSRGPAVVLSGAFAQSTGGKRDTGASQGASSSSSQSSSGQSSSGQGGGSQQATGQRINHVI